MAFHKTGIVPIQEIKCSCGHTIKGHIDKCPHCGKILIPANLRTTSSDSPEKKDQSKVK